MPAKAGMTKKRATRTRDTPTETGKRPTPSQNLNLS
jgi:hypothetical protein